MYSNLHQGGCRYNLPLYLRQYGILRRTLLPKVILSSYVSTIRKKD